MQINYYYYYYYYYYTTTIHAFDRRKDRRTGILWCNALHSIQWGKNNPHRSANDDSSGVTRDPHDL